MRLLCLYPEEWSGTRAREVHMLATCVALAESGVDVTLVISGGEPNLREHLIDVADTADVPPLHLIELPRTLGPTTSTSIFARNFTHWLKNRKPFDLGYIIHLKAGPMLTQAGIPYAYEANRIFTQGQQNPNRKRSLHKLEGQVLSGAAFNIATSAPLALALNTWFGLARDFAIVPGAGWPPLGHSISAPFGPFVYCGSIADPDDFAGLIPAANETRLPLKIVGGTEEEWNVIRDRFDTTDIAWEPRVPMSELPEVLSGARAGLIPTNADSPSGEFACPMKLFDYARCGLPVISTALPAYQSVDVGAWCTQVWCTQVAGPARSAWTDALRSFRYDAEHAESARIWSGQHTWALRAERLRNVLKI